MVVLSKGEDNKNIIAAWDSIRLAALPRRLKRPEAANIDIDEFPGGDAWSLCLTYGAYEDQRSRELVYFLVAKNRMECQAHRDAHPEKYPAWATEHLMVAWLYIEKMVKRKAMSQGQKCNFLIGGSLDVANGLKLSSCANVVFNLDSGRRVGGEDYEEIFSWLVEIYPQLDSFKSEWHLTASELSPLWSSLNGAFIGKTAEHSYKILLIGQTGSGKTSFLNLLCNLPKFLNIAQDDQILQNLTLEDFHNLAAENAVESTMQSKTSDCITYRIKDLGFPVAVIDTPGFGDSRGIEFDKEHVKKILAGLKAEQYVNCVILVVNGRESRMNATLSYVLGQITTIMPKEVLDSFIIVFTNTDDVLDLNFDSTELMQFLGKDLAEDRRFFVENPYCKVVKARGKDPKMLGRTMVSLKRGFENTAEVLASMFAKVSPFPKVHTAAFETLYNAKKSIELESSQLLNEFQNACNKERELKQIKLDLESANRDKAKNASFKSKSRCRGSKKTESHNMICGVPNCTSNCHLGCKMPKTFDQEPFKQCSAFYWTPKICNIETSADLDILCGNCEEASWSFYQQQDWADTEMKSVVISRNPLVVGGQSMIQHAWLSEITGGMEEIRAKEPPFSIKFLDTSDQETCKKCGHSYQLHYHVAAMWEDQEAEQVDALKKQAYDSAVLTANAKEALMTSVQAQLSETIKSRDSAAANVLLNIKKIESLGLAWNYLFVLRNQEAFIEQHLDVARQGSPTDAEPLEKSLLEVQVMIEAVEKAKVQKMKMGFSIPPQGQQPRQQPTLEQPAQIQQIQQVYHQPPVPQGQQPRQQPTVAQPAQIQQIQQIDQQPPVEEQDWPLFSDQSIQRLIGYLTSNSKTG